MRKIVSIAICTLLIGISTFIQAQHIVDSVKFNHTELSMPINKMLPLQKLNSSPCSNRIDKAEIVAVLDMGSEFNLGGTPFHAKLEFEIIGLNNVTPHPDTIVKYKGDLTISGNTPEAILKKDFTLFYAPVTRFYIKIKNYSLLGTSINTLKNFLRFNVQYDEFYSVNASNNLITIYPVNTSANPPVFKWKRQCDGVENYQFQLLRLYNTNANPAIFSTTIDWNNALLLETQSADTSISLMITEGTGYYIWRVRSIGNYYANGAGNYSNWGPWSSSLTGAVTVTGSYYPEIFYYQQFDDSLNWVYTRKFHNSRQKVENITYSDGLSKSRQGQSISSTTKGNILVAQDMYDYSGRKSLSTLSAPMMAGQFNYQERLTLDSANTLFNAKNFDLNLNYQKPEPIAYGPVTNYYSDNNTDVSVPNAEGYPYSRTRYYNDGMNRVVEESAAGNIFRIGSKETGTDRTIKTFYSSVDDMELIHVFGDEAPICDSSIVKTITINQNKISTVSYSDYNGKTLATCLSTNGDTLMDELESASTTPPLLIHKKIGTASYKVFDDLTSPQRSSNDVIFTKPTNVTISYKITPKTLGDSCMGFCKTCDYMIYFSVNRLDDFDQQYPVTDSLFIPAGSCDTSEYTYNRLVFISTPGLYSFERRIQGYNTDPASVTLQNPIGDLYIDSYTTFLRDSVTQKIDNALSGVYNLLETNNLDGLYSYTGVAPSDSILHINAGCFDFNLPVQRCYDFACDTSQIGFENYIITLWKDSTGYTTINQYMPQFQPGQFDQLIINMLQDPISPYTCDNLWQCWVSVTLNYPQMVHAYPDISLLDHFLLCTGKRLRGFTMQDFGVSYTNPGYLSHAYAYFKYGTGMRNTNCEQIFCNGTCNIVSQYPVSANTFNGISQQNLALFNACISSFDSVAVSSQYSLQIADSISNACNNQCRSRYFGFVQSVVAEYYENGYVLAADSSKMYLRNDSTEIIKWEEIECSAWSLVYKCMEGCDFTIYYNQRNPSLIDSVGNSNERKAMLASMTYSYDIKLPELTQNGIVCDEGYDLVYSNAEKRNFLVNYINDMVPIWNNEIERIGRSGGGYFNLREHLTGFCMLPDMPQIYINSCGDQDTGQIPIGTVLCCMPYLEVLSTENCQDIIVKYCNGDSSTLLSTCKLSTEICCPEFCFKWIPISIPDSLAIVYRALTCEEYKSQYLSILLNQQRKRIIDSIVVGITNTYNQKCLYSINEEYNIIYNLNYHHYTLYYYDRVGRLVRTVPPKGVVFVNARNQHPEHKMVSRFKYNSLNQVIWSYNPDKGESFMYYDRKNKLRFTQDAKQKAGGYYSYIKYDHLNRVIESGISNENLSNFKNYIDNAGFPANGVEKNFIVYNTPASITFTDGKTQQNLRNRISYTYNDDGAYTYFSYDIYGNCEWIIKELPELGKNYIRTEYDIITGLIKSYSYNEGLPDQHFNRYFYDEGNRLVKSQSSTDKIIWETDVAYDYNLNGSIKRILIGEDKLQGVDFTYTLSGKLKAINHNSNQPIYDPGKDALMGSTIPADAYGMVLHYYEGDFNRTGSPFNSSNPYYKKPQNNVYDGNIAAVSSYTQPAPVPGMQYETTTQTENRYDQIDRLTSQKMKYYTSGSWNATDDFTTSLRYDANGNITELNRNGFAAQNISMDNLIYHYNQDNNQLTHIEDAVNSGNYVSDIDNQAVNNYVYDAIGNIVQDFSSDIDTIEWTYASQVKKIVKLSTHDTLEFVYDDNGRRIIKRFKSATNSSMNSTMYYVLDLNGALISTYLMKTEIETGQQCKVYRMIEQPLYGSGRVGLYVKSIVVKKENTAGGVLSTTDTEYIHSSENDNWMITINKMQTRRILFGVTTTTLGDMKEVLMTGNSPLLLSSSVLSFLKEQGKNVSITEDACGQKLFSSFVAPDYLFLYNKLILLDRNNGLMPGYNTLQRAASEGNTITIQNPNNHNEYYLFVNGIDNNVYYHVVDVSKPGNGTIEEPMGEIVSANNMLTRYHSQAYTYSMAAFDDWSNSRESKLYLRAYDSLNTSNSIVMFSITASGISGPTLLASYPGNGEINHEMQISAKGNKLGVANRQFRNKTKKGANAGLISTATANYIDEIVTWDIDTTTYSTLSSQYIYHVATSSVLSITTPVYSIDYSPEAQYIYYTRNNALYRKNIISTIPDDIITNGKGEVRRGKNNKMYFARNNSSAPFISDLVEISNPDGNTTIQNKLIADANQYLTGGLPVQPHRILPKQPCGTYTAVREMGYKQYELKDYLGNVQVVISDKKLAEIDSIANTITYDVDLLAYNNYYAFGALQPGRYYNSSIYRYAYNGMEKDDEFKGEGNSYTTYFRQYDPRIGRWLSYDPKAVAFNSPYSGMDNNPVLYNDPGGDATSSSFVGIRTRGGSPLWGIEAGVGANFSVNTGTHFRSLNANGGMYINSYNPIYSVGTGIVMRASMVNQTFNGSGLSANYAEAVISPYVSVGLGNFGIDELDYRTWDVLQGTVSPFEHDWTLGAALNGPLTLTIGGNIYLDTRGTSQRTGFYALQILNVKLYSENDGGWLDFPVPVFKETQDWLTENSLLSGDGGDRFRSTHIRLEIIIPHGRLAAGLQFYTAEVRSPGQAGDDPSTHTSDIDLSRGRKNDGKGEYTLIDRETGKPVLGAGNAMSTLYFEYTRLDDGPARGFRLGLDAGAIQYIFQNNVAHGKKLPWLPIDWTRIRLYNQNFIYSDGDDFGGRW